MKIILVACGKAKAPEARPARDLYVGNLFRAARRFAEGADAPWFILSGKHGLVAPEDVLAPYDERIPGAAVSMRRWGEGVVAQLQARFPGQSLELVILAGIMYALPLREHALTGWTVGEPLRGLEVGERLRWFRLQREAARAAA